MLKLVVIEDHTLVREGLVRLLAQIEPDTQVREAADFEHGVALLEDDNDVDLIFLDLALPGIDGFAGLDVLRHRHPAIPVAVVSAFDDVPTINRVINLGASGFIPKAYSGEELLEAVREILDGKIFRPTNSRPSPRLNESGSTTQPTVRPADIGLTERQTQVLALMVRGLSNRDIGAQLSLSEGTVKIHVTAVLKTLGVTSRTQAMVAVARYGIDFDAVF